MKIIVSLFGEPKDKNLLELVKEYEKRMSRYQEIEFKYFKDYLGLDNFIDKIKKSDQRIYLLAEKGVEYDTTAFTEKVYEKNLNSGIKEILFCIGPAEGWGKNVLEESTVSLLSLSKLTFQHDIAFLVLVEQIYRAVTIKNNLPYHK